jgi:glutathione synthase/RimK-type ligase-like ATP-grasp enzyme
VRAIIYPYNLGSRSARALSTNLVDHRSKRVRPDGRYKHNWNTHAIINWGSSEEPDWKRDERSRLWLNPATVVARATDKVQCLQILKDAGISVPDFTTSRQTAENWCQQGNIVYCRTMTRASGGKGIVLATSLRSIVNAPLYTKQLAIKGEYRVHVFNGEVIDYQKKRKREEAIENGDIAEDIRNINNGWVYCRNNLTRLEDNETYAIRATRALGLNFGAVDIIRDINRRSYILEVNTAPGLEGLTLVNYTNAIRKSLDEMDKARNSWNVNQQRFS